MLARYKIHRGKLPAGKSLPAGIRQDTRKHTRHFLRPNPEMVARFLDDPTAAAWKKFSDLYRQLIEKRYAENREAFDELAALAVDHDVYLGCSCPTIRNPDVNRCHTVLALKFMKQRYPDLDVHLP